MSFFSSFSPLFPSGVCTEYLCSFAQNMPIHSRFLLVKYPYRHPYMQSSYHKPLIPEKSVSFYLPARHSPALFLYFGAQYGRPATWMLGVPRCLRGCSDHVLLHLLVGWPPKSLNRYL
ncbi:hypothetical protein LY76DRAFT_292666 [Colletotrichum caudatum]|nr:hypothetical protein LY76DRAFT_292666 [Colletotrichum caudatum]